VTHLQASARSKLAQQPPACPAQPSLTVSRGGSGRHAQCRRYGRSRGAHRHSVSGHRADRSGALHGLSSLALSRRGDAALDEDQRVWTGGWSSSRPSKYILSRPFIEEGLERLQGVRYVIKRKNERYGYVMDRRREFTTILDTEESYRFHDRWVDLLASTGDEELDRYLYEIRIPRASILRFVLEVVEEVGNLHRDGIIHGDIKPSNALVNRNGKALIDDVGLMVGDISPTVTAGWSPGEQLLRQPLSCAADVFPLGQVLLHVLSAQSLGREVSYKMPDGKKSIVIEDPTIYIAAADGCIGSSAIRKSWCRFIEGALKTGPGQRWPNAIVMAGEMRTLIDRGGISGDVNINLPWGDRPSLVHRGSGEIGVGWAMHYSQITRL
jgi:protein kinase-like protein